MYTKNSNSFLQNHLLFYGLLDDVFLNMSCYYARVVKIYKNQQFSHRWDGLNGVEL